MSYRELTGYEEYDGFYDGYPDHDNLCPTTAEPDPVIPLLDLHKEAAVHFVDSKTEPFDSRIFATRSWHRVLHQNLHPNKVQPYLGFAPLCVVRKTLERTTQMAKMVIRYPL